MLQSFTGIRVSDLSRLEPQHIQKNQIELRTEKTNKLITIPLNQTSARIINKYGKENLPKISDRKYNEYLKDLFKECKLNRSIEIVQRKQGEKEKTVTALSEIISSHKAVNTFITNSLQKGMTIKAVADITGKTEQIIFNHYYGGK